MKCFSFFIGCCFCFLSSLAFAASDCSVKFSWLPNSEPDLVGYKIHYGIINNGPYSNQVDIGNPGLVGGRVYGEVAGLNCGEQYYFVCTAYDADGDASDYSAQVAVLPISVLPIDPSNTATKTFGSVTGADFPGTITDTFININTVNSVASAQLATYTWPANMVANAILMKIDVSQIPANVVIQNATLQLYMNEAGGDSLYDISAHKILNRNPNLSNTTGYTYDGSNSWTANASCYNSVPMAQSDISAAEDVKSVDLVNGYKSWNVTNMVKDWVASPMLNYGLLLNSDKVASADSHRNFASSEAAAATQRPKLIVTYAIATPAINSPANFQILN